MSKYISSQKKERRDILQKAVLGMLATGMVAWPSFSPVYATTITRTDSGPAVVVDGNVHKVYAGQAVGNTGVNRFSNFNIDSGHIANLYFGTSSANTAQFNTLMNFVDNRIDINGTVNAIRNGKIGGHLFFLSPGGMVVGASGAINTGSLTVLTPTNAWWTNKFNNNVTQEVVNAVSAMAVPINASGTIAIQGKVNATDDIRIKAGKINIGMDENDANKTAAALATGVTDFSSIVNLSDLQDASVTTLTAVRSANSGDIELKAEVSYNENTDAANKTVKAIVNVDGNSTITAARNANITAKATYNVKDLTVAEFDANYKDKWIADPGFGVTATTIAEVNITKGTVEAQKIVLDAYAEQKFANSYSAKGAWGEKLTQGFTGILVNGVDVCVGDLTNKATVNVGTDAVLTASSTETDALKVNANAIVDCAVGTQAMSLALLGTLYSQNFDFFPSVNVNSVHVENEATVNLNGKLTAEKSNIAVEANAKDTLTSTASTGLFESVLYSSAVFNFGFNKVGGSNTSNITVDDKANLTANKGISLYSDATTALNVTTNLATTNKAVTAFVINYLDYANISNVNIKGDVTSDTGNIVVNSLGTYTENTFSGSASAGASFLAGIISDGLGNSSLDDLVGNEFKNWMGGGEGNNRNALLAQIFAELDNEGLGLGDGPGENPLPPGEIGDVPAEEQGKSFKRKVADMFKLGLSFGYMKEANKATVTVGKDAKINAKTGNLTVNAVTDMKDIYTAITGATKNPQEYPGAGSSDPTVLANGAIFFRTLDYDASIILEGGAATDTTLKTMDAKTISLTAEAKSLYKRINKMVDNIKKFSGVSEADFKASLGDLPAADKEIIWQAYKSVRDNDKLKDLNKVYDANGNLKPEYTNGSEEYQAVINMVRKLQEEESVKEFNEFLDTGKFTYTDQSGISHTIDMQEHGGLKGFFTQLLPSAFAFLSPANYVNYNLASSTSGRDDSSALAVNVGVGLDHVNNNARVMVGSSREVASTEGNVNIKAITDYGNLDLDGTYYPTTGGGSSFSGGVVVGIHHLNNNSIVAVAESANLNAKKDLSAQAETDVLHIGLNVGMGMAKKNVLTGSINLVSADSNSIISIDDEAVLNAINLQMGGYNRTTSVAVTGGFVMGGTSATGAAVSVVSVKRNNILGIMDNDSVGTMSEDDAKYKADDEDNPDDDETRQKKVLRKFSGLSDTQRTAFFGTSTEQTGSVTVRTLDVGTVTMGNIYSIDADVSLILNGNGSAPGIGSKIGTAFTNLLNKPRNLISNLNAGLMQIFGLQAKNIAPFPTDNEPTNLSEGVPLPKLAFTGIGSVGVNNVDAKTAVVLDKAKITFDKNSAAGSNVLKMFAFDDSTIVVASGGATGNTSEDYIGTGGDKACFTGGAAVNLVNNSVRAIIEDSTIDNADEIKNLAEQDGALGAGGLAINVTKETGGLASTYSLVGGVSVNIGNYNTMALLKNNTVNANPERTNKTNITNRATNKSLQVTAGLDINANQSYGTGIGIGAVFGWGIVHNATVATMHQGNYTQMGAVSNNAITDMTEISGVVGIGVEDTVSGGGFQGAVGINKFDNDVQALVQDVTLTGDSLTVYAYDTTLEKSDEYKKYDKEGGENKPSTSEKLKKLRFDTTGDGYFKDAKKGADQESDTEFLKKHGNSIVTAAVEIQAVTGAGANAAIGAAVVLNDIDNDFTTEIFNSTLTLTGGVNVKAESTTRAVGVTAGGTGTSYGVAGAGSATIGMLNNDVISKVVDSTIKTTNLVVDAFQRNTIVNVAGQVAVGNKVIGLTWAYNYMNTFTGAYLNNSSVSTKDDGKSKATVNAEDDALLYAVAVSAAAASAGAEGTSFGGNGAVGINLGHNNVEAVATTDTDKVLKLTDFTVHSKDTTDLRAGAGGLNIGNAKVAIGGAVALNRIGSLKVLKRDADGNIIYDADGKAIVIEDNIKQSNLAKVEGYTLELGNKLDVKAEDTAKFTTVGVGCGLGSGSVAIQGADATTKLDKTTMADVVNVDINKTSDNKGVVSVIADTDNSTKTIGIVGQLKFGDKPAVSIGMGTSQNLFTADTEAKLRGGTYKLDDLLIKSTSLQTVENDTIGGGIVKDIVSVGGSVTVNNIDNDTKSLLGEVGKETVITANNNVGVISQSDEDVDNYTGEVKVGLGNFLSMGTSIASNDTKGDTISLVKNASVTADGKSQTGLSIRDSANGTNITFTGLVVDADAKHDFFSAVFTANLSAGYNSLDWDDAGGKVVSVGASATINTDDIKGTTKAAVEDSDVNKDRTENLGNVTVKATDYIYQKTSNTNAVANIIFGEGAAVSVGGGISVNKDVRTIDAHIDGDTTDPHDDKKTVNTNILKVLADSKAEATLTNTAATVSASGLGSGGVNVGVTYLKMDETTNATLGNVKTKNNGMSINAKHVDDITLYATTVTVCGSYIGVGIGTHVATVDNFAQTNALVDNSEVEHYSNNTAEDEVKADSDSTTHTQSNNTAVSISLGAGVGVLVANNNLQQTVSAVVINSDIGTNEVRAKKADILSNNKVTTRFNNQNIAGSAVAGIGVGVGINKVDTAVRSDVDGSAIYSAGDISIKADENKNINGTMVAATVGGISIGVSVLHNYIGLATVGEDYTDLQDFTKVNEKIDDVNASTYDAARVESITGGAKAQANETLQQMRAKTAVSQSEADNTTIPPESGTGGGSNRNVVAGKEGVQTNVLNANLYAANNITVLSNVHTDTNTTLGGGNLGVIAVNVELNKQHVEEKVGSTIEDGLMQTEKGNISIQAASDGELKNNTVQAGAGAVSVTVTKAETKKQNEGLKLSLTNVNLKSGGNLDVRTSDKLAVLNKATAVNVGGLTATAFTNMADDSASSKIYLNSGTLQAKGNLTVEAASTPKVKGVATAVDATLTGGSGMINTVQTSGNTELTVGDGVKIYGNTVDLSAKIYKPSDGHNLDSDVHAVGVSVVGINVDKSRTYSERTVAVDAGYIDFTFLDGSDMVKNVNIYAADNTDIHNYIRTTAVGILASESNFAQSKLKNSASVKVNTGDDTVKGVDNLQVSATTSTKVDDHAKASSGSTIGIMPYAAQVENEIVNNATLTVLGNYEVGSAKLYAEQVNEMQLCADSLTVTLAGGAGTRTYNDVTFNTNTNIGKDVPNSTGVSATPGAKITATDGDVRIYANTLANMNKLGEVDPDKKFEDKDANCLVLGNGVGGFDIEVAKGDNKITFNDTLNIANSTITGVGDIILNASSGGILRSQLFDYTVNAIGGAQLRLYNKIYSTNTINFSGSTITGTKAEQDITLAAYDKLEITAATYTEMSAGAAGATEATTESTVDRKNILSLTSGEIHSLRDVNLYSGKNETGNNSMFDFIGRAETYCGGLVPFSTNPTLESTLKQNNEINVESGMKVISVRHSNLYADHGTEHIKLLEARHSMWRDKTNKDVYVATEKGNLDASGEEYKNYVKVDGSITAGVTDIITITIGTTDMFIVKDENEKNMITAGGSGYTVYTFDEFKNLASGGLDIVADESSGLTKDKFEFGVDDFISNLSAREDELKKLKSDAEMDGDNTLYNAYAEELDRVVRLKAKMENMVEGQERQIYDAYIVVPDLVASGGNVNVDTGTLYGSGTDSKITAKGTPQITITNNTNLELRLNNITIDEPGGLFNFNNKAISGDSAAICSEVASMNKDTDKSVGMNVNVPGSGAVNAIDIKGNWAGNAVSYGGSSYTDEDGQTVTIEGGTLYALANIEVNGNINSEQGEVNIYSAYNDIIVEGLTAKDSVNIRGKEVSLSAPYGSITQGFTKGIVNIGGSVQSQFAELYNKYIEDNRDKENSTTNYSYSDGDVIPRNKGRIGGGEIYINALDININGILQSGYERFFVTIDETAQAKINDLKNNNSNSELSDLAVLGNPKYCVVEGKDVAHGNAGYYDRQIAVYYNPATDTLLTENVDASGGKIYLSGRISSTGSVLSGTGSGAIYCMDGAYNIDVTNKLPYDLKTNSLIVNDVSGLVQFTNLETGYKTLIRKNGITYLNSSGQPATAEQAGTQVFAQNGGYYFKPTENLKYTWSSGYSLTTYQDYYKEFMAKWWGLADEQQVDSDTLSTWSDNPISEVVEGASEDRPNGETIGVGAGSAQVAIKHNKTTVSETNRLIDTRRWTTGYLGCHKRWSYTWRKTTGSVQSDVISVKADNNIGINFIGTSADNSVVKVQSTNSGNIILAGGTGNMLKYAVTGKEYIAEKGKVIIDAQKSSVIQNGGGIYGAAVELSAAEDINITSIVNGHDLTLSANVTQGGSIDITAKDRMGASVGDDISNIKIGKLGGTNVDILNLRTEGNIVQQANAPAAVADRINFTSTLGGVYGENNSYFRLQGGQQIIGGDSLSASVNVTADKDIRVQQTTGDLRIGKFHTDNGDVYISVPQGGVVDALPYVERTPMEENELVDLWKSLGMIEGGDSDLNADKNKALANTIGTVYENYCAGVVKAFDRFIEIKNKPEADRTQAEKDTLAVYQKQFKTPDSPDDSPAYFASAADFLAQDAQATKLAEVGQTRQETYKVWDKDLLLYQIDDAIVNPSAGVKSSEKEPNIFGKNINISVQNGVGLNSDKITEINMEHLDKNSVKFLSQVDPSTVTWKTNDSNESIAVITDRLAIGVQQSGVGTINITTAGNAKSNVFLENRLDDPLNLDSYKNLDIAKILAGAGNVTLTSLGSIYDVNTLTGSNAKGYATVATISGNNVILMTGAVGTNNGTIGKADKYVRLNMSGNLTATATGNIYLEQAEVNGSAKNLNILTMAAGVAGQAYSTTSGNIYLKAAGNIYSVVQDSRVQGYIRSDSHGQISFDAVGNIGYAENADGSIDFTKTIRFKNSTVEAEVVSGEVQAHDTVKLHSTAGSINVEGVSTINYDKNTFKQSSGGFFNLIELSGATENAVITVNGKFKLNGDVIVGKTFMLNINTDADVDKNITAKDIVITATNGIDLAEGVILTAETVTLATNKPPELSYGTIAVSLSEEGAIEEGAIYQGDLSNYSNVSGEMNFASGGNTQTVFSSGSKIVANELKATASTGIYLGGKNDCNNVILHNSQNEVVYHNVADVDPDETGDILTVGIGDYNELTEETVPMAGTVWVYNEAVTETETSGQLAKPMAVTSGVYAVNSVDLKSNGDLINQYEIVSKQGSVYLDAGFNNGTYVKEGNLENYGSIRAGSNTTDDCKVEIYATGSLHNHGEGLNNLGVYILGEDGVVITAFKDVINEADLLALTGNVTVGNNASGTSVTPGDVVNIGDIYVANAGYVQLNSGAKLFNDGTIYSYNGDVTIQAQDLAGNFGNIYTVSDGDVSIKSLADELTSSGNVFAGNGSVTLNAEKSIRNTGDMFVHGDGCKVVMQSETGNVVNTSDLLFKKDLFISLTGSLNVPSEDIIYAYGGIELLAAQGNLYNSKELLSNGDIVLKAKGDIIIESDPGLGDEAYLDETSATTRIKNIKTDGGSVTIEGRNVENNMTVEADKGIFVKAHAETDGGEVVANTGTIKIQSNNGHFITKSGNVELTADGYWEHNAYKDETDDTKQQKFSISNGGVNDLVTGGGDIILYGKYSVENVGDIKAEKGDDSTKGNAFLTSDSGNIYNYEYANNADYLEFTEITFSSLSAGELETDGSLKKNAVKDTWVADDGTRPRAIEVEGSIYWKAIKIYNEVGQYSGDDLTITVEDGGTILNKITAGGNVILNCQNGNFTFGGSITAGKGIQLYNTNGSLTILDGASMSAGENIDINAGDYVQSGMKIEAGQGVSVYSENGYVKLDNGITANNGLIRVYSQSDTAATGATTANVEIGGTLYSANGSINISTNSGGIQAENMLAKDLAAIASWEGNVKITGNTKGQKVTFYTEDEAAELTFNKVEFGDEIIMAANGGEGGRAIDMSNVKALSDNYKMGLYGAGGTFGKGKYILDYDKVDGQINIKSLNGDIINIIANEPVKIDNISISKEANIYTMGIKTKIYGTMGPTDTASNEIYYAPGGAQSIYLHEVFFDDEHPTPPNPTTRNKDKSPQVQKMMEDSSQFATNHGGGKGMSLYIVDSSLQYGNGIVLMDTYGSNVMSNRYSATDTMIFLENIKAIAQHDNYFNIGMNFFDRYNIIDIPTVTVNSMGMSSKDVESNGIVIVPAKDDEYEF